MHQLQFALFAYKPERQIILITSLAIFTVLYLFFISPRLDYSISVEKKCIVSASNERINYMRPDELILRIFTL